MAAEDRSGYTTMIGGYYSLGQRQHHLGENLIALGNALKRLV